MGDTFQNEPITVVVNQTTQLYYTATFQVTEDSFGGDVTITPIGEPTGSINFGNDIQSDQFVTGVSGWRFERDTGNGEIGAAFIRDTLQVGQIPDLGQAKISGLVTDLAARATVFRQTEQPGGKDGDIWYDIDDDNHLYVRSSGSWVSTRDGGIAGAVSDADIALTTANAKPSIFRQNNQPPTTNRNVGDTWYDTDDENHLHVWNGTAWTSTRDGGIQSAINTANTAMTQVNSKSAIFSGTTFHTNGTSTNDLFYRTDEDKFYMWNGSNWVAVSITADSIVAGYVYAGQISASQITASTITADFFQGRGISGSATASTGATGNRFPALNSPSTFLTVNPPLSLIHI